MSTLTTAFSSRVNASVTAAGFALRKELKISVVEMEVLEKQRTGQNVGHVRSRTRFSLGIATLNTQTDVRTTAGAPVNVTDPGIVLQAARETSAQNHQHSQRLHLAGRVRSMTSLTLPISRLSSAKDA